VGDITDVCFGTITSGRDIPHLEVWNIVGSFFNVLPCRIAMYGTVLVVISTLNILLVLSQSVYHRARGFNRNSALAHYTNSRDVCFGTITSGRDIPHLEVWNIVGSF
jgi:hypothetical protein